MKKRAISILLTAAVAAGTMAGTTATVFAGDDNTLEFYHATIMRRANGRQPKS